MALAVGLPTDEGVLLVVYGAFLGTLIDLDHFLLARLHRGDWRALRYCLSSPSAVFLDQSSIFAPGEVGQLRRLLSHVLIGGALVGGLYLFDPFIAAFSALILYAHLVGDLIHDVRRAEGVA